MYRLKVPFNHKGVILQRGTVVSGLPADMTAKMLENGYLEEVKKAPVKKAGSKDPGQKLPESKEPNPKDTDPKK